MSDNVRSAMPRVHRFGDDGIEVVPSVARSSTGDDVGLTARETQVIGLVARGLSDPEIGVALDLRPNAVRAHVSSACRKIGATSRTRVTLWWQTQQVGG